ncbi:hypothetical protein [Mesorhizobium sp. CAU 1741]|uniref:hypothetical protein n=1 Tax=Mesorhizobium sp. CAU 1741 TaxID=3140366 RepID=UPI00325B6C24
MPDMRSYGGCDTPEAVDEYSLFHIVGDMIALLDAVGESMRSSLATIGALQSRGNPHS